MRRKSKRHSLLDELEMRWEDEQKLNGLSSVHSMGFRQFIFYLAHKVDFIAEIFLCTMILFGNVGAQPAASFLLKFASFYHRNLSVEVVEGLLNEENTGL